MKKVILPAVLAAAILVAGIFAYMPVQKASTVHTTILQTLERPMVFTVSAGDTALNEVPLLISGTDGDEFRGDITITILDSIQPAGGATAIVECFDFTVLDATVDDDNANDVGTEIVGGADANTIGETEEGELTDGNNCEVITLDVVDGTDVQVVIQIESIV